MYKVWTEIWYLYIGVVLRRSAPFFPFSKGFSFSFIELLFITFSFWGVSLLTKEAFNCLAICEQVRVVNNLIISHGSIRQACKVIGIGKTTIRDRFKRYGYVYVSSLNQYDKANNLELNNKRHKIIDDENKHITLKSNNKLEKILPDVLKLLELKDDLEAIVKNYKNNSNCMDIVNKKLEINKFNSDLKVKSIKIYKEVLDRFNKFMLNNKQFKQQEILSQALWEFLQRYDS